MTMPPWQPVTGHRDQLGESPYWHPDEGRVYWVDIPGRALRRLDPRTASLDSWPMPHEPGCIAPVRGGGLVIALRTGIFRAHEWGGALELLQAAPYDTATTRCNDGKADPVGRFWIGTLFEPKHTPAGELFSLDARTAPMRFDRNAGGVTTANGLAWSPDARTLYWTDTQAHVVRAWHWDAATNALSDERVMARFDAKPAGWQPGQPGYGGRPDGAAVDADGNYWCAMYEGGRLLQLSPGGQVLRELATPFLCPTMPCFGGDDLRTLYVTSAGNRSDDELARYPLSGRLVALRVDVPGLPVNFFIDAPQELHAG
ncbi:SMP-30/gluconolactonase/LRE family protein [Ramlibacter algicola]|uniref:SMP-30/gluconolactonase/LRE family protein n=1 Tax=Ramlibacter algicola TaxID=2795217 RepID=A0A934PXZ6_9BURK|nr:SMP-30/gluconolactonase/LRE family protein [Ramlibacter algicola]MBK0391438.1 SMP-30/gluconolactonase/LRE family protein [Ramlibacter algicola]